MKQNKEKKERSYDCESPNMSRSYMQQCQILSKKLKTKLALIFLNIFYFKLTKYILFSAGNWVYDGTYLTIV